MQIEFNTLIEALDPFIQSWDHKKRSFLASIRMTDLIQPDFFFHITGQHKPIGEYLIRALDAKLLEFDRQFIEKELFPRIIEFAVRVNRYSFKRTPYVGIDFGFEREGKWYLVAMETPDSSQWGFEDIFGEIRDVIEVKFTAIVGSYLDAERYEDCEAFLYFSGRSFWSFIADEESFPSTVIRVIEEISRTVRQEVAVEYGSAVNRIERDTILNYCDTEGAILWEKIAYSDLSLFPHHIR